MKKTTLILLLAFLSQASCGQSNNSSDNRKENETKDSTYFVDNPQSRAAFSDKFIDKKYVYTDSLGKGLIIENSLPKGGMKYKDPNGKEYAYTIFWTHIKNTSDSPVEVSLVFPADSIELLPPSDNYFKLLLPTDKMTSDKEALFDYGLEDLNASLDHQINKPSSYQRTIQQNMSVSFYVVALFDHGLNGPVRTGLSWKDPQLFYTVNGKAIQCGEMKMIK